MLRHSSLAISGYFTIHILTLLHILIRHSRLCIFDCRYLFIFIINRCQSDLLYGTKLAVSEMPP